ncbi:MAG: HEAT repeat domain-containing protein [Polyangiales bacterium]
MAETTESELDIENLVATALDKSASSDERIDAIDEMCEASPVPDRVHETLVALLRDSDDKVRGEAITALRDAPSPRAIDALIGEIEREKSSNPRWIYGVTISNLCQALGACGEGDPRAIDALIGQLRVEQSMYAARGAYAALIDMGPRAARARDALEVIVRDGRPWEQAHAHLALWAQDDEVDRHVRALVPLLAETKEGGGSAAAAAKIALERIGERAIAILEQPDLAKGRFAKHARSMIENIRARSAKRAGQTTS